ncbi:MAG: response regulator [Deltaproteobacteria bacterium]|nr:MAG: response regulator [Deltaproteobacteria bacterium]
MTGLPRHCLLVVDDEPDVCDSVHDLLRLEFEVLKARSADEGYRLMQENEVHIIMTDQRMPRVTGVELLANVRARHPYAIRILFTGYADVEAVIAAINQGRIFRFLRKPWQPEEIEGAVREAAAEYDRLVKQAEERERLRAEIAALRDRLSALEEEVRRLRAR